MNTRQVAILGGAGFLPSMLPNLAAWYSADVGVLNSIGPDVPATDGQTVRRWLDRSGNGRHLDQTTLLNQPVLSGVRITTNGSNQFMHSAGWTLSQPLAVGVATTTNSLAGDFNIIDGITSRVVLRALDATSSIALFSGVTIRLAGASSGYQHLIAFVNGANSVVRKNGRPVGSGNTGANSLGGLSLSSNQFGSTEFLNQNVAEIVIWKPSDFLLEAFSVERYYRIKWGEPL